MEDATTTTIDPEQFEYECTFPGAGSAAPNAALRTKGCREEARQIEAPHMGDAQRFTKAWLTDPEKNSE